MSDPVIPTEILYNWLLSTTNSDEPARALLHNFREYTLQPNGSVKDEDEKIVIPSVIDIFQELADTTIALETRELYCCCTVTFAKVPIEGTRTPCIFKGGILASPTSVLIFRDDGSMGIYNIGKKLVPLPSVFQDFPNIRNRIARDVDDGVLPPKFKAYAWKDSLFRSTPFYANVEDIYEEAGVDLPSEISDIIISNS